jgi:TPR repeat protein
MGNAVGRSFGCDRPRALALAAGLLVALVLALTPAAASEFKSYRKSNPAAFEEAVRAYDRGDYAEAYRIWLPLAQHQDPAAMRNVAHLLRRGLGVTQDLKRALVFYKRAAGFGVSGAQANLALMYYEGQGTQRDPKEAARWFLAAARQGHVLSQYELGLMLEKGDGVPLNPAAARVFYAAAAKGGFEPAAQRLAALDAGPASGPPAETALLEPQPGSTPGKSPAPRVPRQRPADAGAMAAAFLLRGSLTDVADALEMAPDEIWTLRASFSAGSAEAALLGFTENAPEGPGAMAVASLEAACANPSNPFDRRASLCRMPPVWN